MKSKMKLLLPVFAACALFNMVPAQATSLTGAGATRKRECRSTTSPSDRAAVSSS